MTKHKELKRRIQKTERLFTEAECALQYIFPLLTFDGFDMDCTPNISYCNGGEIILEFKGREINIIDAFQLMETKGYISIDNFI